jgi:hypothetical protein
MTVRPLAVLAILPLMGCANYAAPRLQVTGAHVAETSPQAAVLRFDFDAENPNEVELPLREIRYSVSIGGREVFRGVRSPESTLRRLGSQSFSIPAVMLADHPLTLPADYAIDGTLVYITPGSFAQVLFDTGVRRPSVSFRHQGTLTPEPK